jgi:tRNA G18 (ribose-2'-O)-methylase SpoU
VAELVPIDDPGDERVADYLHLTDAELRRRGEVFLCEGVLVIRRAIQLGTALRSLLVTAERWEVLRPDVEHLDLPVYVVAQEVMNAVTGFNIHRGAIAAAVRPEPRPVADLLAGARTVAVLEGVNDLENLGALFRNAAAFGIDAVLLDETTADPLYRRCVRVSLGHVLAVPHARYDDLDDLRAAGFETVALTPSAEEPIGAIASIERAALLLGAEGPGLTAATLAEADRRVRIPMVPGVDSLNVATAAAVAFHHRFAGA